MTSNTAMILSALVLLVLAGHAEADGEPTSEDCAHAVAEARLLAEPGFRRAAETLGADIRRDEAARSAEDEIEALAG